MVAPTSEAVREMRSRIGLASRAAAGFGALAAAWRFRAASAASGADGRAETALLDRFARSWADCPNLESTSGSSSEIAMLPVFSESMRFE